MKFFDNIGNKILNKNSKYKQIRSLFEVECFLQKASTVKKSLGFVSHVKHLSCKKNKS